MEHLQRVKVNIIIVISLTVLQLDPIYTILCLRIRTCNCLSILTAVSCTELGSINNGSIAYSSDTVAPFDYGTTATYSCNEGLYLEGNQMRTCQGDDSSPIGTWSGMSPVCAGLCSH